MSLLGPHGSTTVGVLVTLSMLIPTQSYALLGSNSNLTYYYIRLLLYMYAQPCQASANSFEQHIPLDSI